MGFLCDRINKKGRINMKVEIREGYGYQNEILKLFTEYTAMLISKQDNFNEYLKIQNYDEEVKHLEKKYGRPEGRLYILFCDEKAAGCIALRKLDNENCEMKRLYIVPKFRGKGIGNLLIEKIISDAKEIGYRYMLLDTLPFLKSAVHRYKQHGFYEIPRYNNSPGEDTIYMRLDLK